MIKTVALLGVCAASAFAQHVEPDKAPAEARLALPLAEMAGQETAPLPPRPGLAGSGFGITMAGPALGAIVTGAPYAADAVTERVQTLPDGNRIVQTTSSKVARDSQGRVHREDSLAFALPSEAGKGEEPKIETIDDPVAGLHWTLDSRSKTALKMAVPKHDASIAVASPVGAGPENSWFFSSGAPGSQISIQMMTKHDAGAGANMNRTDLGMRTMEGVSAQGTRTTRTIPAGEVGNEQPIVITSETWYSPDLKVLVFSRSEDPRIGVTTYRLTNVSRAEPSASLFEVPSGYTVNEVPANVLFHRELKKD